MGCGVVAYLLRKHTDHSVETTEVAGPLLRLGRGTNVELRLDDKAVNLEHAQVRQQPDGQYTLTDVNSVTGTYVKGKRVQTATLHDGDQIVIGPFLLTVSLPDPSRPLSVDIHQRDTIQATEVAYAGAYALDRRWLNKPLLTLLLLLAGAGGVWYVLRAGQTAVFRPGFVSTAHALFTNQCFRCHQPWQGPSEQACQECHAGPVHHEEQVFTPSCLSCHAEHRDRQELVRVVNGYCLQCHADLKTKNGKGLVFAKTITDFAQSHPEFALTVQDGPNQKRPRLGEPGARQSDTARITFSHGEHLKADLESPKGPVQLVCKDCHIPAVDGKLMAPITYEARCKGCHALGFDPDFSDRVVPHASPEEVRVFLIATFAGGPGGRPPAPAQTGRITRSAPLALTPGVIQRIQNAERYLYTVTCNSCHEVERNDASLPAITPTAIPTVWLPHARFSHRTHRSLGCASCHGEVGKSQKTSDVLLPGIQVCRECHQADTPRVVAQQAHASTDCVTCHLYHDKSQDVDLNGPFTVKDLAGETGAETVGEVRPARGDGPTADESSTS